MIRALWLALIFTVLASQLQSQVTENDTTLKSDLAAKLLNVIVPAFEVKDGTILDGIAVLTKANTGLAFSFEDDLKQEFHSEAISPTDFSITLQNRTVRQLLDELCRADSRFQWTRDGNMINVFPGHTANEGTSYLLNRKFNQLEFSGITNAQDAVFAAVKQLPPPFEQIAIAQAGGNIVYAAPWSAKYTGLTVRQALNIIALQLSSRSAWIFGGSKNFRTITFYTGSFTR
jgi:hypothetical protein